MTSWLRPGSGFLGLWDLPGQSQKNEKGSPKCKVSDFREATNSVFFFFFFSSPTQEGGLRSSSFPFALFLFSPNFVPHGVVFLFGFPPGEPEKQHAQNSRVQDTRRLRLPGCRRRPRRGALGKRGPFGSVFRVWPWRKKPVPKWNPGKWKHGPKPEPCLIWSHMLGICLEVGGRFCRGCRVVGLWVVKHLEPSTGMPRNLVERGACHGAEARSTLFPMVDLSKHWRQGAGESVGKPDRIEPKPNPNTTLNPP